MIRFAWIQARVQTVTATAILAVMAIVLGVSGAHLVQLYHATMAGCSTPTECSTALHLYMNNDSALRGWLGVLVAAGPAIVGIFWGAPMVAGELETGTFRLAWTQSVTRNRWLVVKLAVVGLAAMATAGLLSLIVTWWASPLDRARADIFNTFDERDIVPVGFALFALMLGVAVGLIIRRTLPAMAATLAAFVAARLAVTKWVRPDLIAPLHKTTPITASSIVGYGTTSSDPLAVLPAFRPASTIQLASPKIPNAWIYSTRLVDHSGHGLTASYLKAACPAVGNDQSSSSGLPSGLGIGSGSQHTQAPASAQQALHHCGAKLAAVFHEVITYQPGSRYWDFQWLELAIYTAGGLALAGMCVWWIRRRPA